VEVNQATDDVDAPDKVEDYPEGRPDNDRRDRGRFPKEQTQFEETGAAENRPYLLHR